MMRTLIDPTFPGLSRAVDTNAMLTLLRDYLPELKAELELSHCEISHLIYEPGAHCRILYDLSFENKATGSSARQFLSAWLLKLDEQANFPPKELVTRYEEKGGGLLRTPFVYLPEIQAMLYAFPIDPFLPWLFDALDETIMRQKLDRLWERRNEGVRQVGIQLLRYKPFGRATILYEILSGSKDTEKKPQRLVGKMHIDNRYRESARLFANTWTLQQAAAGRVVVPSPVGYISSLHLTIQQEVQGECLAHFIGRPSFIELVRQTARQLAAMHGLSLPLTRRRTPQHEARAIYRRTQILSILCPDLVRQIENLRNQITSGLEMRCVMTGPVHGDFQCRNVFVKDHIVTLIDLDDISYGDPLLDVARFLASLHVAALQEFGSLSALAEAEAAFLEEYLSLNPEDEKRIYLFESALLFGIASDSFRNQRPQWHEEISMILEEAERLFRLARPTHASVSPACVDAKPVISFEDRLRWATDATYMQALLAPCIQKLFGAEITSLQVMTEDSEQCYHIQYTLSGWLHDERWNACVRGLQYKDQSGGGLWYRLRDISAALGGRRHAPLLPRLIAYFPLVGVMILQLPAADIPFATLIGAPEFFNAATRIGLALAAFHHAQTKVRKVHTLKDELFKLRQKLEKLKRMRPDLSGRVSTAFAEVEKQIQSASERTVPILRKLTPSSIFCDGGHIAFPQVDLHVFSHPLIDAGSFLAGLTLLGIQRVSLHEAHVARNHFCRSYFDESKIDPGGLDAFEAAALLGLAFEQSKANPQAAEIGSLLMCAEDKLAPNV